MDNELFMKLYGAYQKELYLYLYSLCRNRHQAEDLLHETFLKALLALPDGHTNMRAWLLQDQAKNKKGLMKIEKSRKRKKMNKNLWNGELKEKSR